ncbi:MAG: cytochrome c oxidase subunit II [Terriglobales bacterium]
MGLALLIVIWLITLISTYYFYIDKWPMPPLASAHGGAIDEQMKLTFILMGVVFLAAQLGLGLFVWKYRDRSGAAAHYSHGHNGLEWTWTVLTAVLFIGLNLMGYNVWAANRFQGAQPGALQVEVTAVQFAWYFRYPGPDGKFGKVDTQKADASAGNEGALGLDPTDPASADDVVVQTLYLPVNKEADVTLHAQDVIHNFNIPAMRVKQDAVPGLLVRTHFTPAKTGRYEIACAELCGLGHYKMRAFLEVQSEADFNKWMAERLAEKQQ